MRILLGSSLGFCDRGGSSFHVGKILAEIIIIVVIEIEMLRGVILRLLNLGNTNHEDFMAKILNFLVLFA